VAEAVACSDTAAALHPHELTDLARRSYVSPYPFAIERVDVDPVRRYPDRINSVRH
jgi:hypothetical protein